MNKPEEHTYGMVSEWRKGQRPILPWNKEGKFLNVYVSKTGVVFCFAEKTMVEADERLQVFLKANDGNANLEWAASFDRDVCENWINEYAQTTLPRV